MDRRSVKTQKATKAKIFSIILYLLPILFFVVSYFFLTSSGEDIFQGAGNLRNGVEINVIENAKSAFNFNGRITDMYAWSVIDFYDYQYSFGIDTVFRLIDVILAVAVFYFATYLILNRKPKLSIKDAVIFCATFVTFIVAPFGYAFYREFSMIHNYVPLALVTLLFAIPYLKLTSETLSLKHPKLFTLGLFLLGIYFGMATTITPLAFLITVFAFLIIKRKKLSKLPCWFFTGIVGIIIGLCISWFAGGNISNYASEAPYDYIAFSEILTNLPKLLWHEVYNFGIVLVPLLCLSVVCFIFSNHRRQILLKIHKLSISQKSLTVIETFSIFIVVHILGASLIESPFRILIPAYLAGIILLIKMFIHHINFKTFGVLITISTIIVLLTHTILLTKYHAKSTQILQEIKTSDINSLCIDYSRSLPTRVPILDLSQANLLVNWGIPEPIYGKNITFCNP